MTKTLKNPVEQAEDMIQDMDNLTVQEISLKERAKMEDILYIEPKRKMSAFGKLLECEKKAHAHDWEYVKGILENQIVEGEPVSFWYCKYGGDHDCLWEIPCNRTVYLPRMIAKHLEEVMQYHTFGYVQRPDTEWTTDEWTHKFGVTGTKYRAKFRPTEAFA